MPATWPKSGPTLRAEGYYPKGMGTCRGCAKPICWSNTPAGKLIPLSKVGEDWQPHWVDCPNRDQFRKKKKG